MPDLFAYTLYTDGSCLKNPGPGGWAWVCTNPDGSVVSDAGGEAHTTNNRMEITAALKGLEALPAGTVVEVHSDSTYLVFGVTKWIRGWKAKGYIRDGMEIPNADLWRQVDRLTATRKVKFIHVRGHAGNAMNELCDSLARKAAEQLDSHVETGEDLSNTASSLISHGFSLEKDQRKLIAALQEAIAFLKGGSKPKSAGRRKKGL